MLYYRKSPLAHQSRRYVTTCCTVLQLTSLNQRTAAELERDETAYLKARQREADTWTTVSLTSSRDTVGHNTPGANKKGDTTPPQLLACLIMTAKSVLVWWHRLCLGCGDKSWR